MKHNQRLAKPYRTWLLASTLIVLFHARSPAFGANDELPQGLRQLKLGSSIDLIKLIDVQRDTKAGHPWTKTDDTLVSSDDVITSLQITQKLPEDYVIRANVRRQKENNTLGITLKVRDNYTHLYLNGWYGKISGLHMLDNREARDTQNETRSESMLIGEKFSDLLIAVKGNSVQVYIDGKQRLDWEGDPNRLTMHPYAKCKEDGYLWLATMKCNWEFSSLSMTPILGVINTPTAKLAKVELPTDDKVESATKTLEKQYSLNLRVRGGDQKAALAKQLLALAVAEADQVNRYVLLSQSATIGSEVGDLSTSWEAAEKLGKTFAINERELKIDILRNVYRVNRSPSNTYLLAIKSYEVARDALDEHQYDEAYELINVARNYAKLSRVSSLSGQLNEMATEWKEYADQYEEIASVHQAYIKKPGSKTDALTWGRFVCLVRNQWQHGLPILANAGVSELSTLANDELKGLANANEILSISNRWREIATSEPNVSHQQSIYSHIFDLVQKAYPDADSEELIQLDNLARECMDDSTLIDTTEQERGILIGGQNANIGSEGTIELWFRTIDDEGWVIAKREQESLSSIGMHIHYKHIYPFARAPGYMAHSNSKVEVNDGKWHHAAVVKYGTALTLFIDGQLKVRVEIKNSFPAPSNSPWRLGYTAWIPNRKLNAVFSRVRVSGTARYHVPFIPSLNYKSDRATMLFK